MSTKLVVHHTYERGMAFDVSETGNHGDPYATVAGAGAFAGSLRFASGASRVDVRPSPSLAHMRAIRGKIRFVHQPSHPGDRRHNLFEGDRSFALFINPDGSLQSTLLDRYDSWQGPWSAPGMVHANQWHEAELLHDGVSRMRLDLDGVKVGESFGVPGPVRDVGSLGLTVGHWPEDDPRYTLEGHVDDFRFWVYDPDDDARRLTDRCCLDRAAIDSILRGLRRVGFDGTKLGNVVGQLLDIGAEVAAKARAGDAARTHTAGTLSRDAMLALALEDWPTLQHALEKLDTFTRQKLSNTEVEAYGNQALALIMTPPLGDLLLGGGDPARAWKAIRTVAATLCLDGALPREPQRPEEERPPEERPQPPREGDPHTDGDPGEPPPDWRLPDTSEEES